MSKNFRSNLLIIFLLAATIGVITAGVIRDKKIQAAENKKTETMQTAANKQQKENSKEKEDKKSDESKSNLDVYGKISSGKDIKILVAGDSIGKSIGKTSDDAAWDVVLKKMLKDKYNINSEINNISEDSAVAYKGYSEIMSNDIKDFDIAIICFGTSDQYSVTTNQFSSTYEAVIRQLKKKNTKADIIPVLSNYITNNNFSNVIRDLSNNYKLDLVDMDKAYKESGININELSSSKVHPSDKGYKVYAEAIEKVIENNIKSKKTVSTDVAAAKNQNVDSFDKYNFVTKYDTNTGFTNDGDYIVNNADGDYIEYTTTSSQIGLSYLDMKDGGLIKVYVNGAFVKQINTNSDRDIKKAKLVAENLSGTSKIRIKADNKKVKIEGIITN